MHAFPDEQQWKHRDPETGENKCSVTLALWRSCGAHGPWQRLFEGRGWRFRQMKFFKFVFAGEGNVGHIASRWGVPLKSARTDSPQSRSGISGAACRRRDLPQDRWKIRSKTSIMSRTRTSRPVSSSISRATPACSDSPSSSVPPGMDHCPRKGSLPRLESARSVRSSIDDSAHANHGACPDILAPCLIILSSKALSYTEAGGERVRS